MIIISLSLSSFLFLSLSIFPAIADPIDLTSGDDDLQKALALSIQEMNQGNEVMGGRGGGMDGGNMSQEDEDLSRSVETGCTCSI